MLLCVSARVEANELLYPLNVALWQSMLVDEGLGGLVYVYEGGGQRGSRG